MNRPPEWERTADPDDRRRTLYWRLRLPDHSWLTVTPPKGRTGIWLWVWRDGPERRGIRYSGEARSLDVARRRAEAAVAADAERTALRRPRPA